MLLIWALKEAGLFSLKIRFLSLAGKEFWCNFEMLIRSILEKRISKIIGNLSERSGFIIPFLKKLIENICGHDIYVSHSSRFWLLGSVYLFKQLYHIQKWTVESWNLLIFQIVWAIYVETSNKIVRFLFRSRLFKNFFKSMLRIALSTLGCLRQYVGGIFEEFSFKISRKSISLSSSDLERSFPIL